MKRPLLAFLLLAAGWLLAAPASSLGANLAYVGCSSNADAAPSHVCQFGDSPGAFFESETEVEYEVCVKFPSGEEICLGEQIAEPGVLFVNEITSSIPGTHLVTWFVEGAEVAAWDFRLDAPPAPPAVVPPPPATVIPVTNTKCRDAKRRVEKLKSRLRKATKAKQKAAIRATLKNARASMRRACG
ncbi:MAG: hypothetical protein WBL45_00790 [Solirubrobacterales bacterium]